MQRILHLAFKQRPLTVNRAAAFQVLESKPFRKHPRRRRQSHGVTAHISTFPRKDKARDAVELNPHPPPPPPLIKISCISRKIWVGAAETILLLCVFRAQNDTNTVHADLVTRKDVDDRGGVGRRGNCGGDHARVPA